MTKLFAVVIPNEETGIAVEKRLCELGVGKVDYLSVYSKHIPNAYLIKIKRGKAEYSIVGLYGAGETVTIIKYVDLYTNKFLQWIPKKKTIFQKIWKMLKTKFLVK